MPNSARLSPSVPPLVKTISAVRAPEQLSDAVSRLLDRSPRLLPLLVDGRGVAEALQRSKAASPRKTSGSSGLVALLSR